MRQKPPSSKQEVELEPISSYGRVIMERTTPRFDIPVELRFRDLDAYGHVNNAAYFTLIETARVKFLHHYYPEGISSGPLFVVARATCDFRRPMGMIERVIVTITATEFGRSSFSLIYTIRDEENNHYADATTKMVAVDCETKRPTAVPTGFDALLKGLEG